MQTEKVIIIGSGPAAWAAATYAARADLKPLVLAGEKVGGQLILTRVIENFPGYDQGIDGPTLMGQMRAQAERFGTQVREEMVESLDISSRPFGVKTATAEYKAEAVVIATGAESVWLNVPKEKELLGRGVSTCAVCDAAFFRGKRTVVVGGGDAAMEDALALTKFAETVTVIHRRDSFRASKVMAQRVLTHPKINVLWNTGVESIVGDTKMTGVVIKNLQTGEVSEYPADGLFVAIGHKPATSFLKNSVLLDEKGYIVTRLGLNKQALELAKQHVNETGMVIYPTMTTVEGVFAAGDCVDARYRQAATASAFGVMAALDVEPWLELTANHN